MTNVRQTISFDRQTGCCTVALFVVDVDDDEDDDDDNALLVVDAVAFVDVDDVTEVSVVSDVVEDDDGIALGADVRLLWRFCRLLRVSERETN